MTKQELLDGETFTFTDINEEREAEVSHSKSLGGAFHFKIFFNGTFVHMSKTYPSMKKKLNALIEKFKLIKK